MTLTSTLAVPIIHLKDVLKKRRKLENRMTQQHHHQLSRGEENNEFFNFWGVLKNVLWPLLALENVLFLSLFSQLKDKKMLFVIWKNKDHKLSYHPMK